LIEIISSITGFAIEEEIKNVLNNFEPRVSLQDIEVTPLEDQNAFFVKVTFYIGNNTAPTAVNLLLERNR